MYKHLLSEEMWLYRAHNDNLSVAGLQFAIAQYSYGCDIHYNFNQLKIEDSTWETKVASIPYFTGATYTANAIQKLV